MKHPEVSILIPTFNRENYIAECIQSALDQSDDNFEVVVVDNASTDRTWEICREFSSKDQRVRAYQNEQNIGPVRNWQRCIDEARGQYGKILFSDDLMAPEFLEKCVPYIKKDEVGFVFSAVEIGAARGLGTGACHWKKESGIYSSKDFISDTLFGGGKTPLSPGAALFRLQDLKNNLRTDIPSPSYHDFAEHGAGPDLWLYLGAAKDYPKIGFVDEQLTFFRAHADSITISNPQKVINRYRQAKIYFASQFLDHDALDQLLIVEWIRESVKQGFLKFSVFCRRYLSEEDVPKFKPLGLMKVCGQILVHYSRA